MEVAAARHITELVQICRSLGPDDYATEQGTRGFGGASFRYWRQDREGTPRVIFGIAVAARKFDTPDGELDIWIRVDTLAAMLGTEEQVVKATLSKRWKSTDGTPPTIRLKEKEEATALMQQLKAWFDANSGARAHAVTA